MPLIRFKAARASAHPWRECWSHAAQQLLQGLQGVAAAGAEIGPGGERDLRFGQGERGRFELEPAVPADRCRRRAAGLNLHEQQR